MAYVKILPNKSKVGMYNLLKYLFNDHDGKIYATASNLSTNPTVAYHMIDALNRTTADRKIKTHAQHIVQSFSPKDNITPEKANELGHELMERLGYKQYAYTIVTHYDKGQVHNHIVFSPTSLVTKKQYQSKKTELNRIRNVSDDICQENRQSVIETKEVGYKNPYINWTHWQRIHSAKKDIKRAIDKAIQYANSTDILFERLKSWGYGIEEKDGKILVKHQRLNYAIDITKFGKGYTKPELERRIVEIQHVKKATKQLLDLSNFHSTRGRNLAAIENIKLMSQALHFMKKNHLSDVYDFNVRQNELMQLQNKMTEKMTILEEAINRYQDFFTDVEVVENNSILLKQYLDGSSEQKQELMKKYNMEQMLKRLERGYSFYLENKVTLYEGVQQQCALMEKLQILKEDIHELNTQIDVLKNAKDVLLEKNLLPNDISILSEQKQEPKTSSKNLQQRLLERMKEFAEDEELLALRRAWLEKYKSPIQQEDKPQPNRYDDWER